MKIEGKSAPRRALRKTVMFGGSLGCLFVLSLFCYVPFIEKTADIEQRSRLALEQLKRRWSGQLATSKLQRINYSDAPLMTELLASQTSDIYPQLKKARAALAEKASLDPATVWVSCWHKESGNIAVVAVSKDTFRNRGAAFTITLGDQPATLYVDDANGVNTKLSIKSEQNWIPLTIAYPIDRGGLRLAYYTPAHYQLRTPELVADGKAYVHNHIVQGTSALVKAGYKISAVAQEMAGKLSIVEHVDHQRFVNEPPTNLFAEIYTLYALNRGETYRWSISVAGAGGMIQMIPSTYRIVRERFPAASLTPSFVEAMSNHAEAMKAMLLYIEMTYDYFQNNGTVAQAMTSTLARVNDLMAAGYNSNPARIPGYISRNQSAWTRALPRETNIYLSILHTLENPEMPQVDLAREFLSRPSARYHVREVRARSVARKSRGSKYVARNSRGSKKYKVKAVARKARRR